MSVVALRSVVGDRRCMGLEDHMDPGLCTGTRIVQRFSLRTGQGIAVAYSRFSLREKAFVRGANNDTC